MVAPTSFFAGATFWVISTDEFVSTEAFEWRRRPSADDQFHRIHHLTPFHSRERYGVVNDSRKHIRKSPNWIFKSLLEVAENGATTWSNHVAHQGIVSYNEEHTNIEARRNSLEQKSSIHASQLYPSFHQYRINRDHRNIDHVITDDGDISSQNIGLAGVSSRKRDSPWPAHFLQEALAYIAGGAAATCTFTAVVAGTIMATVIVTLGAISSALFFGDEIDDGASQYQDGNPDDVGNRKLHLRETGLAARKDCHLNVDVFSGVVSQQRDKRSTNSRTCVNDDRAETGKLRFRSVGNSSMAELKKCSVDNTTLAFVVATTCSIDDEQQIQPCDDESKIGLIVHGEYDDSTQSIESSTESNGISTEIECDRTEENCYIHMSPVHPRTDECDEKPQPRRIELIWYDAYHTAANDYYSARLNKNQQKETTHNQKKMSEQGMNMQDSESDGALLISETFRVTSSALGLLADTIRFGGETTAALAGGSARLVGNAVKAGGWAVGNLGLALSSESSDEDRGYDTFDTPDGKKRRRARTVAGASVKLIGDAIENVAESLLFAGSATERFAFAFAGAAEGTIRVVEDFTSSLAGVFGQEGQVNSVSSQRLESDSVLLDEETTRLVESTVESISDLHGEGLNEDHIFENDQVDDTIGGILTSHFILLSSWILSQADNLTKSTGGVASLAPLLLVVFTLLYFTSIILFPASGKTQTCPKKAFDAGRIFERVKDDDDDDTHSALTDDSTMRREPDVSASVKSSRGIVRILTAAVMIPLKLCYVVLVFFYNAIFNRRAFLLVAYAFGWLIICQTSQQRSEVMQRKAMLSGYRSAVESIGSSSLSLPSSTYVESAFWLNVILSRIWNVQSIGDIMNGGLEPFLSNATSELLSKRLDQSYSGPGGVAHVSLSSFTFGRSAPMVRNIVIIDQRGSQVRMSVDVVMLLDGTILMLDVKPSSLDYKMVPATKVSISSVDFDMTLDVSVQCSPQYPYISRLNVSLSAVPDFSLRIMPQEESGLKGIDFGALPLISKWVKDIIAQLMQDYISPHYISIDIPHWLTGVGEGEYVVDFF